jgi:hypothetical protein
VEENYIGAEEFCRVAKQDEAVVLRGETILLEALDFDLIVYTPYRPLQGFLLVSSLLPLEASPAPIQPCSRMLSNHTISFMLQESVSKPCSK